MPTNYLKNEQGRMGVSLDGENYWVRVEHYAEGQRPALVLESQRDPSSDFVATANTAGEKVEPGELLIKNYSENRGVLEALEAAGIVERTGKTVPAGYASLDVVRPLVELPPPEVDQQMGPARDEPEQDWEMEL